MNDGFIEIKTNDSELMPTRAHPTDAGLDLKACDNYYFDSHINERVLVDTGISVRIPTGYVGILAARSSLQKKGLMLANSLGIIDSTYRGNIKVPLVFFPKEIDKTVPQYVTDSYGNGSTIKCAITTINKYERIAQLIIVPIRLSRPIRYDGSEEEWNSTSRGTGGFGSTGT